MQYSVTGKDGQYFLNRVYLPLMQVAQTPSYGPYEPYSEALDAKTRQQVTDRLNEVLSPLPWSQSSN